MKKILLLLLLCQCAHAFELSFSGQVTELQAGQTAQIPLTLFQDRKEPQKILLQIDRNTTNTAEVSQDIRVDWNAIQSLVALDHEKTILTSGEVSQIKITLQSKTNLMPGYYGVWVRAFEESPRKNSGQEIQIQNQQIRRIPVIFKIVPSN